MEIRFDNKVVLITGGSSGIGFSAASLFAEAGAIVYNLDIQNSISEITGVTNLKCDVSDFEQVSTQIATIIKNHGQIHHAFLNAGMHQVGNVESLDLDIIDTVININIKGVIYCLKCILPTMREHQAGSIVLMGSDQSLVGKGDSFIYGATKGAIAQLTKSTAIDYAAYNIRINCVCPGTIETPLYHNAVANFSKMKGLDKDEVYKNITTAQPIPRVGLPEEVANTVLFLCSEKTGFTTGSLITIDGGYVAQ
ncbi:MAG: SDR family oxidoreductase [Crocinitomix sp.]|nr:SDR family oxidoreductase [Crocinitomix sp.]